MYEITIADVIRQITQLVTMYTTAMQQDVIYMIQENMFSNLLRIRSAYAVDLITSCENLHSPDDLHAWPLSKIMQCLQISF